MGSVHVYPLITSTIRGEFLPAPPHRSPLVLDPNDQRELERLVTAHTAVFTPKHASRLNLIEIFFSKMAALKAELKCRIELYPDEVNASPVVFQWRYKLDEELV